MKIERVATAAATRRPVFGSQFSVGSEAIEQSWDRCRSEYGLDPGHSDDVPTLSSREIRTHLDELGDIVPFAEHMLERLYRQIAGTGYVIILADKNGLVLRDIVDPVCAKEIYRAGVRAGADWSEASQGTNAIGSAIAESAPIIVHQNEHFVNRNHVLTCAAAPIYDPEGQLMAVLDATSPGDKATKSQQTHTLALVLLTVRAIENRILSSRHKRCRIIRLNNRVELIGLEDDALLAVSDEGLIAGMNRRSAEIFLPTWNAGSLIGQRIDELLDVSIDEIVSDRRTAQLVRPVHCRNTGKEFYLAVEAQLQTARKSVARTKQPAKRRCKKDVPRYDLARLAGKDHCLLNTVATAMKICDSQVPMLIVGETGTGKGALALAIHDASARDGQPFVTVDCTSIPKSLIESELFGYRPGAFTGAERGGHQGLIRQADGGTLFLDEIGDMPLDLQSRLLRVLEEQEVRPLGGDTTVPVDLNILSATHCSLERMIRHGEFRQDLYYRLNGVKLQVPALRDRSDFSDVVANVLRDSGDSDVVLGASVEKHLADFDWPGNIRQLRNVLFSAVALSGSIIELKHLPDEIRRNIHAELSDKQITPSATNTAHDLAGYQRLQDTERDILLHALEKNRWHMTQTAHSLDISRSTLYRRMLKHNIPTRPESGAS